MQCHLSIIIIVSLKCTQKQDLQKAMFVFNQRNKAVILCPPLFFHSRLCRCTDYTCRLHLVKTLSLLIFLQSPSPSYHSPKQNGREITMFSLRQYGSQKLHHFLINWKIPLFSSPNNMLFHFLFMMRIYTLKWSQYKI